MRYLSAPDLPFNRIPPPPDLSLIAYLGLGRKTPIRSREFVGSQDFYEAVKILEIHRQIIGGNQPAARQARFNRPTESRKWAAARIRTNRPCARTLKLPFLEKWWCYWYESVPWWNTLVYINQICYKYISFFKIYIYIYFALWDIGFVFFFK